MHSALNKISFMIKGKCGSQNSRVPRRKYSVEKKVKLRGEWVYFSKISSIIVSRMKIYLDGIRHLQVCTNHFKAIFI